MKNSSFNPDCLIQPPVQLTDATRDIMPHILKGLSRQDAARLMCTCRDLRDLVKEACRTESTDTPFINSQNIDDIRASFRSFISRSPVFEPVPVFMIGDIKTLEGYDGSVYCVEKLSDTLLASGSNDGTIKIWNFKTDELVRTLEGHDDEVTCVKKLSDTLLVSGSFDGTVEIWNFQTDELVRTLEGHDDEVTCVKKLSDTLLASGSWDGTVKIWNFQTGELVRTLERQERGVRYVEKLSDTLLASGLSDNTVKIWNFQTGELLITLEGHERAVYCVEKLSDTLLASGSLDRTIKIWNLQTGECVATENYGSGINDILLLPENHLALGLQNGSIKVLGGSLGE